MSTPAPIAIPADTYLYMISHVAHGVEEARSWGHEMALAHWDVLPNGVRLAASCRHHQCRTTVEIVLYPHMGMVIRDNGVHAPCPMPVLPPEEEQP